MTKPTINELHTSGRYELVDSFRIDDMNQFLMRELGFKAPANQPTKNPFKTKGFWVMIGCFGVVGMVVGYWVGTVLGKSANESETLRNTLDPLMAQGGQVFFAFLTFFLLIPIHEVIHALMFKYYKADKVGFGWSWKSLIVYAYAQNFVHTMRELSWVAVMPFLVISTGLIVAWVIWSQYAVFWATNLFLHTTACIGDFVLMNYHRKNSHRNIYTYDDLEVEKRSYFFVEKAVN